MWRLYSSRQVKIPELRGPSTVMCSNGLGTLWRTTEQAYRWFSERNCPQFQLLKLITVGWSCDVWHATSSGLHDRHVGYYIRTHWIQ
jgi:hypothetical protein